MLGAKIEAENAISRWKRWPLAAAALAVLCAACAPKNSIQTPENAINSPAPPPTSRQKPPDPQIDSHHLMVPPEKIVRVTQDADIKCDSGESCPAGVAMLLIKDETGLSQCTGFLIDQKTIMTNSHCLPKELRSPGASCSGLTAVFPPPAGGATPERVACESVLYASAIGSDEGARMAVDLVQRNHLKMDFALLSLKDASQRQPLAINSVGLGTSEALSAWTVDPVSEATPGGILRKKSCLPTFGTVLAPDFNKKPRGAFAPVAALTGCEIVLGNSGSPLLDAKGEVRALIFATLPARQTVSQSFAAMSLATNLACVDPKSPDSSKCSTEFAKSAVSPQLDEATATQLKQASHEWAAQGDGLAFSRLGQLAFTSIDDGDNDLLWSEPRCLNQILASRVEAENAPIWRVHFSVNSVYQPAVTVLSRGKMALALSPDEKVSVAERNTQAIKIERTAVFAEPNAQAKGLKLLETVKLPPCRSQSRKAPHTAD